jgi:hypothetical protein
MSFGPVEKNTPVPQEGSRITAFFRISWIESRRSHVKAATGVDFTPLGIHH